MKYVALIINQSLVATWSSDTYGAHSQALVVAGIHRRLDQPFATRSYNSLLLSVSKTGLCTTLPHVVSYRRKTRIKGRG